MIGVIVGALSALLPVITAAVKALAVTGMAIQGLKVIANAVLGIAKALGFIKPETNVQEMGDKALQAEATGIKPENFNSYEDFVKEIENFKLDPEKSKLTTEEEKVIKGIEIGICSLAEAKPELPIKEFMDYISKNAGLLNSEAKIAEILKLAHTDGKGFSDVVGFMNGTEKNDHKIDNAVSVLKNIEKTVNPDISDKVAFDAVMNLRR